MSFRPILIAALALMFLFAGIASSVAADNLPTNAPQENNQDTGTATPVRALKVPEVTPTTGFRYLDGALVVAPQISFDSLYSTNVLELPPPTSGDLGLVAAPAINIKYDAGNYGGALAASYRYTNYVLHDTLVKKEYLFNPSAFGKINEYWTSNSSYKATQQAVSNAALGAVPKALNTITKQQYKTGLDYAQGPWFGEIAVSMKDSQFYSQSIGSGATTSLYELADFNQISKLGYNFNKTDKVYALVALDRTIYTMTDLYDRNSLGYLAAVGFAYAFNPALNISGQLGYLMQDYADPRFAIVSTLVGYAKLKWQMDATWSTELNWSRLASELVYPGTPGIFINTYDVALRKQYDPKTLIEARVQYIVQEAIQLPIEYDEWVYSIGCQYVWNDHTTIEYGYKFNHQITSDNSQNFDEHIIGGGITYKF
ncbi:MAG: hypothetical protein B7Y95_16010 [Rhizobiales bacterium 32-66-11]|nr:MAG: hypothetical protein B7Y95_16010 [Rhizobiales bacterium 32-66-11]